MALSTKKHDRLRDEWIALVNSLLAEAENWALAQNWSIHRQQKTVIHDTIGVYPIDVLKILTPNGQIVIDPIARDVRGGDGRIDVFAWPSLNRVRLIRRDGVWIIRTDSGVDLPGGWTRENFLKLAYELATA
jgi:hypothetical protein